MIEAVLEDELRWGAPVKFSAEQVTQIIAIACVLPLSYRGVLSVNGVPGNWLMRQSNVVL